MFIGLYLCPDLSEIIRALWLPEKCCVNILPLSGFFFPSVNVSSEVLSVCFKRHRYVCRNMMLPLM